MKFLAALGLLLISQSLYAQSILRPFYLSPSNQCVQSCPVNPGPINCGPVFFHDLYGPPAKIYHYDDGFTTVITPYNFDETAPPVHLFKNNGVFTTEMAADRTKKRRLPDPQTYPSRRFVDRYEPRSAPLRVQWED